MGTENMVGRWAIPPGAARSPVSKQKAKHQKARHPQNGTGVGLRKFFELNGQVLGLPNSPFSGYLHQID